MTFILKALHFDHSLNCLKKRKVGEEKEREEEERKEKRGEESGKQIN